MEEQSKEEGERDTFVDQAPQLQNQRDEWSGALGTSELVSGPSESDSKDSGNLENISPLSPQWLSSKPGESKPPAPSGGSPRTPGIPSSDYAMIDAPGKDRWRNVAGAPQDPRRTRDWWRTICLEHDTLSSRRERWREEVRESSNNPAPRRDQWKGGERDTVGDQAPQPQNWRAVNERWPKMNVTAGREVGERLRRISSQRWADTPNREVNCDTRRDHKWSSRWGPNEKGREFRGKWGGDGFDKEGGKDGVAGGGYHLHYVPNVHSVFRDADREKERGRAREREKERERERELDTFLHDQAWRPSFASGRRGDKEDSGFDGHREDDSFDQPGSFVQALLGGDGIAFDKLVEARFADAEETWESRARVQSTTGNDGVKEENLWKGGRLGEEVGPEREDWSLRRDTAARNVDGAWGKFKSRDKVIGVTRDDKVERQDRIAERDDCSTWRRSMQDDPKTDHGVLAERGAPVLENRSKRPDQEPSIELKDAAPLAQKIGKPKDQGSRNQDYTGIPVGQAHMERHVKTLPHTYGHVELEREREVEREEERVRQARLDAVWEASFDVGEVLPWHQGASPASISGLPMRTLVDDRLEHCSICLEGLITGNITRLLPCFHLYHQVCIDEWLQLQGFCPLCKIFV